MMAFQGYSVVKILDSEDLITIVSNTWLREEGSYAQMPSVRGTHYYAAVKNHTAPDVDVVSTAVSIIVSTISFQHAREMERQSERGMLPSTDDTIPMGLPAKRAIRRPVRSSSDDEDAARPSKPKRPSAATYARAPSSLFSGISPSRPGPSTSNLIAPPVIADVPPSNLDVLHELQAIKSLFLDELCLIRSELVGHRRMSEAMLQMLQRQSQSVAPGLSLPFISLSELKRYDERLKDPDFKIRVVNHLCAVHGDNIQLIVRGTMERLMTRSVAAEINYSGARGSFAFRRTNMNGLVQGLIRQRMGDAASDADITRHIKTWLHSARHKRPPVEQTKVCSANE
ncbi:unnamed protein product, partial [Dicrocoelium dendriticum]